MSTSSVCAETGAAGCGRSTPAMEHSVFFVEPCASGLQTETNGALGSFGLKMRMLTYDSHSIVTSSQDIAFVPVELVHDCTSPSVTRNFSTIGGGSPHAAS